MESLLRSRRVTFDVLRARLVEQVKLRINNGEFTERGLARILGISQSQAHNVLKGARTLQIELADRILSKLDLSAMDLLTQDEWQTFLEAKSGEWHREFSAKRTLPLGELLDMRESIAPRKPSGRMGAQARQEDQKAG